MVKRERKRESVRDHVSKLLEAIIELGDSTSMESIQLDSRTLGLSPIKKYYAPPGATYKSAALCTLRLLGLINDDRRTTRGPTKYTITRNQFERLKELYRV